MKLLAFKMREWATNIMKILFSHEQNPADSEVWVLQNGIRGLLLKKSLGTDLKDSGF